ncbi:SCO3374 family protein [Streptomyces sp. CC228A]|uniref:SCO3374 family protein n=1 Tax=Streptomyces sp. CC228A TaxID=2898186 RepID=UPI0035A8A8EC
MSAAGPPDRDVPGNGGRTPAGCLHGADGGAGPAAAPEAWLATGLRFDVLDLPAAAGLAALARLPGGRGPVALSGCRNRVRVLVAAGSAEELPGLLDWLEWSGVDLDLAAWGADGRMPAPAPPGWNGSAAPGTTVWLRAPVPGHEVEPTLPGMTALPGRPSPGAYGSEGPGLVRLVAVAAAECHRHRLLAASARRREATQRLASS